MDLVNFPRPGSPMVDHMDWDWVCESGMAGGDNSIQLDGSTHFTKPEGGMKFFNVYGIYEQNVKLNNLVRGSGVEWYFIPLNCDMWADNDVNEDERFALKLRQLPCYSRTGLATEISRVSRGWDIHYISSYKPQEADTTMDEQSNDEWLDWFFYKYHKDEVVMEQALDSYEMQREAAKLDAAPPVGEPAILKLMAPIYFHCTDKKDGTPIVVEKHIRAVYFGFETCIADTDDCMENIFYDTEWAMDRAHEVWWDVCNWKLIPYIRDLELNAEEAKRIFEDRDIIHGDLCITRQDINQDLFDLCYEGCRDLDNPDYQDEVMECFTAAAEQLLDHMCDIVAQGGDLSDFTDRELYNGVDMEAWDCYQAFIYVNEDIEDLRERLYSVGAGADLHEGNIAYWNGNIVCIDFGACSST